MQDKKAQLHSLAGCSAVPDRIALHAATGIELAPDTVLAPFLKQAPAARSGRKLPLADLLAGAYSVPRRQEDA